MTTGRGRTSRSGLVLVLVLIAAPFLPALVTGRSLYYRDVGQLHLPNRALTVKMIRSGEAPLWNPHRGGGQPFLANPNSLVLRPTTPLFLLFPPEKIHVPLLLSVLLLFGIAAAGTWGLLRDIGLSVPAAVAGALAFALSGPVQSLGQVLNHLEGVAWIPVTLWLLNRAFVRGWRPWAVLAGFSSGLVISSGEPVWSLSLGLAALALPGLRAAGLRRVAGIAGTAALLGLMLAAVQLLPLADLARHSARAEGLPGDLHLKWSVSPAAMMQTILPDLWGDPSRAHPAHYWGAGLFETSLPWMPSIHLGAPVLALGIAGALRRRRAWCLAAVAVAAAAGLLAMGRYLPPLAALTGAIPGISSLRYPVKWLVPMAWSLSILAAAGLDRLFEPGKGSPSRWKTGILIAGGAFTLGGLLGLTMGGRLLAVLLRALIGIPDRIGDPVLLAGAVPAVARSSVLAGGTLLLLGVALPSREGGAGRRWLAALSVLIVTVAASWNGNPTAPPEFIFAGSPLLNAMPDAVEGRARFVGLPRPRGFAFRTPSEEEAAEARLARDSLAWGLRWDVRTLRFATPYPAGLHGAFDQRGEALLDLRPGSLLAERIADGQPARELVRYMRAASAKYLLAYGEMEDPDLREISSLPGESNIPTRLLQLRDPLPRTYLAAHGVQVATAREAIRRTGKPDADLAGTVYLESQAPLETGPAGPGPASEAEILEDRSTRILIGTRSEGPAWLVLTDTYDRSWRAQVDGRPAEILRANGMFRAVRVPGGESRVLFTYRPLPFYAGAGLAGLALAGGLILLYVGGRSGGGRAGEVAPVDGDPGS